jgi:hypothetical protein
MKLLLVSLSFDQNSSNYVSIIGGLLTLDFDRSKIVKGIDVKIVWIGGLHDQWFKLQFHLKFQKSML